MRGAGLPARSDTQIPQKSAHASGNATISRPPSASPRAYVPSAGRKNSRPVSGCAIRALRRGARPSAPVMPRARRPANSTAAKIRIYAAELRGRGARSASMHASTPGFARVAATVPLSRAARPVSRAVTPGGRPNASNMPRGGPKVFAADAAVRPTAAPRAAPHARCSSPGAINRRMPPAASATPGGAQNEFVPTAANRLREHPAVRRAPTAPICDRASIAVCRFRRRATPSSKSQPAKITEHLTTGPK